MVARHPTDAIRALQQKEKEVANVDKNDAVIVLGRLRHLFSN